jgi:hypothetical protein
MLSEYVDEVCGVVVVVREVDVDEEAGVAL